MNTRKYFLSRTHTSVDAVKVSCCDQYGWEQLQYVHPVEPLEGWGVVIEKFHGPWRWDIAKVRIGCT